MDTNSLLSQDEIDSLFKQATGKSVNRSPAAETEQPAPVITPVQSAVPTPQAEIIRPAAAASQAAVSPKPAPPVTAAPRNDTPVVLKRAAPPAAPPAQRPPPQPVPVAAETNDDQNETNEILLNISERLSDMERRLAQLERSGAGRSSQQGALQQSKVERLSQQFRGLAEAIQVIQAALKIPPITTCGLSSFVNTAARTGPSTPGSAAVSAATRAGGAGGRPTERNNLSGDSSLGHTVRQLLLFNAPAISR